MKPLSIRNKIWLTILSVSVVAIGLIVIVSYYLYQTLYIEKQTELLLKQGSHLESFFYKENLEVFRERLNWMEETSESKIIFTNDPMELASGAPFDSLEDQNLITFSERQELLLGKTLIFTKYHKGLEQEIRAVVIPLLSNDRLEAVIFMYVPLTAIAEIFQPIKTFLLVGFAIVLVLLVIVGTKMTNRIVRPLKEMDVVAREISQGSFSKKVSVKGRDEIASLGTSINVMSTNLEAVDEKRREFLGNVSHELRTPISYLKGYNEALKEKIITPDRYMQTIEVEIERMNRLVHDLLDLAQLEGDSYPMSKEPVILTELLREVLERFYLEIKEKNLKVELNLNEDVVIIGDPVRMDQVIVNLLSNSIKYTEVSKTISISIYQEKEEGVLKVRDEGVGIPEKDVPYIFERFYRVEKARTRKLGGTGLGLSIVQQIVKKHNGSITIKSEEGFGTTAIVKLPLFEF
ncbi:Sensor histidine kinase YycG [Bacillus sp. THAF10]|uniref:sensor histidine kinase n=1 Tax=Bacillus sp. THAF10 TaxID=2587848 RepID=UPI0012685B15|nr:ATP-binding protein [Bacillus sp. THAF10]QFT88632.1 Sensor histidine kinase YycG [Bacillus sp. THAF10]